MEPSSIAGVLTYFGLVITAILNGIGQIASFCIDQPLIIIALMITLAGVGFRIVRSLIHN